MSFADKINEVLAPALAWAAQLDQEPLVQAALATTLTPLGKNVVVGLISALEAHEAAHEQAKQDAAAQAYQQGRTDQANESQPQ